MATSPSRSFRSRKVTPQNSSPSVPSGFSARVSTSQTFPPAWISIGIVLLGGCGSSPEPPCSNGRKIRSAPFPGGTSSALGSARACPPTGSLDEQAAAWDRRRLRREEDDRRLRLPGGDRVHHPLDDPRQLRDLQV